MRTKQMTDPQPVFDSPATEGREMVPKKSLPKPHLESPALGAARAASAAQLLDELVKTGTPPRNLIDARLHFADLPDATAEQAFRYLESAEDRGKEPINPGTIRKAGKWLWGNAWEPAPLMLEQDPAEFAKHQALENMRLREKNAQLEAEVQRLRQQA
jgi:hypothetical protein